MDMQIGVQYAYKFYMVDSTSHVAGKTGLNNAITCYLSKGTSSAANTPPAVLAANSGATGTGTTEIDSTNMKGWYQIILTAADLNTLGDLGLEFSATGADNTSVKERVVTQIFSNLQLDPSGYVKIATQVRQNTAFLVPFQMTVNGTPTPGLTGFTASRNIAGAGFAPCVNSVVEEGSGFYHILLQPADTNGSVIDLHITATGADDRNLTLYTQP